MRNIARGKGKMGNRATRGQRMLAVGVALLALLGAVRAETTNTTKTVRADLPDIVVTGSRLSNQPVEQPYAFYRTTDDELEMRVGRTALDRFNYGPGVFVQRTAPNQASPFIRGLTGEQTLLMLDGIRFSHAMMRPGPNQYAALVPGVSIESLDAILGSSSTVNGSDGLTGALDYRLAPAGRSVDSPSSPWINSRVDSSNGGTLEFGVDGVTENWDYSVELSGSTFHDRVGGDAFRDHLFGEDKDSYDEIPNTAYDELAGGLRMAYHGLDDHLLALDAGHTRQLDAPRPGGYSANSGDPARLYRYFDPQAFSYIHLRDRWQTGNRLLERLQTTFWWHQFTEEQFRSSIRDMGTPDERIRRSEFDDTLYAYGIDLQATTLLGTREQHKLTWGSTYIYETTDNSCRELRTPKGTTDTSLLRPYNPEDWASKTSVPDGSTYRTLGLFAQDDWQFAQDFSLLTGIRYSRYDWSFDNIDGDTSDVTGSLRGIFDLPDHHHLFAGVSRGFRAPNLNNLAGAVDRGSSGIAAKGSADLEPEISYTYEAGWKWSKDRDSMALTAFKTEIEDLIQRDFSRDSEFTNVEGADLHGFEAAWDYGVNLTAIHRLALVGAVSYVDAARDIPLAGGGVFEDNISRANRLCGRGGLKYERGRNWWCLAQVRWHDAYDDVALHSSDADADDVRLTVAGDPDGSMPGYAVFDIMGGWRSADGKRSIGLFVENIADKTYRVPGSGTDGVGLNVGVIAGLRY